MANRNMLAPMINAPRSRFDLSYGHSMTMNVGTLYPCYVQEIYPGDTFNCNATFVVRVNSAFVRPVFDNCFLDIYYFFVPNRLVHKDWEQVFGENKDGPWVQSQDYYAPHTDQSQQCWTGTVGDYLGLPASGSLSSQTGAYIPAGVNMIPFRSFALIWSEWFRDQNNEYPEKIEKGDWDIAVENLNTNAWSPTNYTGQLPKVNKFHDIFTSALRGTQKGNPVQVPLVGMAPVIAGQSHLFGDKFQLDPAGTTITESQAIGINATTSAGTYGFAGYMPSYSSGVNVPTDWSVNMAADLSQAAILSVPDIRNAFQLQKILERAARSGTRYTEYILSAFGVSSPDSRLQRPEYLGGKRVPISVQQVASTNRGSGDDELATLGAFSLSNGKAGYQKGFVEHGFVIGVCCLRTHHTYQQGIPKYFQRKGRFDYYDPILANISEVPVYASEMYTDVGMNDITTDVFGYQEAWYDLRQRQSTIAGQLRSNASNTLDVWHFADKFANRPVLNAGFLNETPNNVARTLAVTDYTEMDQFSVNFYFDQSAVRRLPTYSIPGLIDHH